MRPITIANANKPWEKANIIKQSIKNTWFASTDNKNHLNGVKNSINTHVKNKIESTIMFKIIKRMGSYFDRIKIWSDKHYKNLTEEKTAKKLDKYCTVKNIVKDALKKINQSTRTKQGHIVQILTEPPAENHVLKYSLVQVGKEIRNYNTTNERQLKQLASQQDYTGYTTLYKLTSQELRTLKNSLSIVPEEDDEETSCEEIRSKDSSMTNVTKESQDIFA